MRINSKMALVIAAIALLFLIGWNSKAQHSPGTNWEYKVLTIWGHPELPPPNLEQLNKMGNEGWDLVTVGSEDVVRGNSRQTKLTYYFKRPI